jgi:flavin reductase (DIM6/NTAB) family NADH-FMN oxidoreductase RutF
MQRSDIPPEDFLVAAVHVWQTQWLLLAAGDLAKKEWNCMTVGWGSFGVMWGRPFAQIVVRPTRHTVRFTDSSDSFTLCAFPEEHRRALSYLGSHSGRDGDKVKASGLTPIPSHLVSSPGFEEAELIVECRTMYRDDIDPARFVDPALDSNYPKKDYHHVYFGDIVAITGTPAWRRKA